MPGYDGTGPLGGGRRTGGGFGNCPGEGGAGQGMGRGLRSGGGRGVRRSGLPGGGRNPTAQGPAAQDVSILERIQAELAQLKQQLSELVNRVKG
jgi:hypothetical protein